LSDRGSDIGVSIAGIANAWAKPASLSSKGIIVKGIHREKTGRQVPEPADCVKSGQADVKLCQNYSLPDFNQHNKSHELQWKIQN
jgi:hypothetical protein